MLNFNDQPLSEDPPKILQIGIAGAANNQNGENAQISDLRYRFFIDKIITCMKLIFEVWLSEVSRAMWLWVHLFF